jgi:hypothetical protein
MNVFLEAGALGGFLTCVPNGFRIDRPILTIVAGEQPGAGYAMVETPMGAECREQLGAEHDIAILCAGKSYALWTQTEVTEAGPWE